MTIDSEAIQAIDGDLVKDLGSIDDTLQIAWSALGAAVKELREFFAPVYASGLAVDQLYAAMRVYGRARPSGEAVHQGDLVKLSGIGEWRLAFETHGSQVSSIIGLRTDDDDSEKVYYEVQQTATMGGGAVDEAWAPATSQVLDPNSQMGLFWGPSLSRFRALLYDAPGFTILDYFLEDVFSNTALDTSTAEAALKALEPEMHPISDKTPLWPGTLLFRDDDESAALVVAPDRVLGVTADSGPGLSYMPLADFNAAYVHYPHPPSRA